MKIKLKLHYKHAQNISICTKLFVRDKNKSTIESQPISCITIKTIIIPTSNFIATKDRFRNTNFHDRSNPPALKIPWEIFSIEHAKFPPYETHNTTCPRPRAFRHCAPPDPLLRPAAERVPRFPEKIAGTDPDLIHKTVLFSFDEVSFTYK